MAILSFTRELPLQLQHVEDGRSKRQVRYAQDTIYRDKAKDASRKSYRKRAGLELESCLYSLQFLNNAARLLSVQLPSGKSVSLPVLTIPKTADMLQHLYQTLWRWIDNGVVPAPFLQVPMPKRTYPVYHLEEVRILIEEIGEHERHYAYLRSDHKEVRARIERRILAFRKTLSKLKR